MLLASVNRELSEMGEGKGGGVVLHQQSQVLQKLCSKIFLAKNSKIISKTTENAFKIDQKSIKVYLLKTDVCIFLRHFKAHKSKAP